MRERTNIMLESEMKKTLQRIADNSKASLSDIINQRLSSTLTMEERLGGKPEWMNDLKPYLATHFSNMEIKLPDQLREHQDKMDQIDSLINNLLSMKEYFREKYRKEVESMI